MAASADFSARLWDAVTGDQVHEFVHRHIVKSVHFKADRSKLATAGHEGILRIYDVASPASASTEVRGWDTRKSQNPARLFSPLLLRRRIFVFVGRRLLTGAGPMTFAQSGIGLP